MDADKTVFIIGSGRSGTTILYNILATHPEFASFSTLSNNQPGSKDWLRFQKLIVRGAFESYVSKRIINPTKVSKFLTYPFQPSEGGKIYRFCGFEDGRKMTENDYDGDMERKLKDIIKMHMEVFDKKSFINKRTANTQRLRLINIMFPDAYYIHMIRDGRAVINSYLGVDWWNDMPLWWLGKKVSEYEDASDPIELAAIHWMKNFEEIVANKHIFQRYIEVRYEELVHEPKKEIKKLIEFVGLSYPERFQNSIPEKLPNMNYKWRKHLTNKQVAIIDSVAKDLLEKLGYK